LKRIFISISVTGVAALVLFAVLNEYTVMPVAIAFAVTLILILSYIFAKKITAPISKIATENPEMSRGYKEISELIHKINRQDNLIGRQMKDLRKRQEEFKTITENMSEGLILVDKKAEILSFNKSALRLLGVESALDGDSVYMLSRRPEFIEAVKAAISGRRAQQTLFAGDKVYELYANPVIIEKKISGAVIIILDITEREKREEMRREFSSNVSHELKTPLTSISGISELMMNGMIKPEDISQFAKNIFDESARLLSLVNDIIKISRLDEAGEKKEFCEVDLFAEAEDVKQHLTQVAAQHGVELCLDGESATVLGDSSIINEIIYNLCDNAIKYNKEKGRVDIFVSSDRKGKTVTVRDTGVGIAAEHLDRIFERFYRVDKSHSRLIGGTGLGLSIVKHGAEYHGATIKVKSTEGLGTEISVRFK
ncbi:MAG: PAS domain S-box protein, partial [Clostridia bacterium]|nr:PAS domain S-box protein [Clostridia bacterium]